MHVSNRSYLTIILTLGALTALGPFSIDMYLPGFPIIARELHTTTAKVGFSLSSFFIGISAGQLLYGPLMDRFGRKPPLIGGLALYILSSIACAVSDSIELLIAFRFVQAIGACAASVGAMTMVRDIFPVEENAKVFALLILILGISPLIAPTVGGYVTDSIGWQAVFVILACIALLIAIASQVLLPAVYKADPTFSLKPEPIIKNFAEVFKNAQFITYALTGAVAFSGLFVYVSGSPQIFMEIFHLDSKTFGWIFAGLSIGLIGASQVNTILLKKYSSQKIILVALVSQAVLTVIFLIASLNHLTEMYSTIAFIFLYLVCLGLISPNASALSLAPFTRNAGSASSVMGALQMAIGAAAATGMSFFHAQTTTPMVMVMSIAATMALCILVNGRRYVKETITSSVQVLNH